VTARRAAIRRSGHRAGVAPGRQTGSQAARRHAPAGRADTTKNTNDVSNSLSFNDSARGCLDHAPKRIPAEIIDILLPEQVKTLIVLETLHSDQHFVLIYKISPPLKKI